MPQRPHPSRSPSPEHRQTPSPRRQRLAQPLPLPSKPDARQPRRRTSRGINHLVRVRGRRGCRPAPDTGAISTPYRAERQGSPPPHQAAAARDHIGISRLPAGGQRVNRGAARMETTFDLDASRRAEPRAEAPDGRAAGSARDGSRAGGARRDLRPQARAGAPQRAYRRIVHPAPAPPTAQSVRPQIRAQAPTCAHKRELHRRRTDKSRATCGARAVGRPGEKRSPTSSLYALNGSSRSGRFAQAGPLGGGRKAERALARTASYRAQDYPVV
jgi:hypothetical protein